MKTTTNINKTIKESKEYPGIMRVNVEATVTKTEVEVQYTGPRISPEVWHQVISFFKWTYDTTKSESQVRLFLDTKENKWLAWAFPQEAKTGMTAKEIAGELHNAQRASLPNAEHLTLFGTVHHHCSASAFQSGTDEDNEKNQSGIHITVGSMDKPHHDLHCRFYHNGVRYEPDMSLLWDIGDSAREAVPKEMHNHIARYQMGKASSVEFPKQWAENLIEVKSAVVTTHAHEGYAGCSRYNDSDGYYMGMGGGYAFNQKRRGSKQYRLSEAATVFVKMAEDWDTPAILKWADEIKQVGTIEEMLLTISDEYDVQPKDLLKEIVETLVRPPTIKGNSNGTTKASAGAVSAIVEPSFNGREDYDPVKREWSKA